MFTGFGLVLICLAWSLFAKPGSRQKMTLRSKSNLIKTICLQMDSATDEDLTPIENFCLVCLRKKDDHVEHCNKCDQCIRNFHLHSTFYNKCFGDGNIRPFIWFHILTLMLCCLYIQMIGRAYWTDTVSEFLIGKLILTHQMMSSKELTAFIMLEFYTLYMFERCLLFLSAVCRGLTINEFAHPETYKYLFYAERVQKGFDDCTVRNVHRRVSFLRSTFINPLLFFSPCRRGQEQSNKEEGAERPESYLLVQQRGQSGGVSDQLSNSTMNTTDIANSEDIAAADQSVGENLSREDLGSDMIELKQF